jgi:hypothetical protein
MFRFNIAPMQRGALYACTFKQHRFAPSLLCAAASEWHKAGYFPLRHRLFLRLTVAELGMAGRMAELGGMSVSQQCVCACRRHVPNRNWALSWMH